NYTVKTELRYPADLLEVKLFTFTNSWMPIAQPGYDLIDNTNGTLIKTAGYPGGVSSTVTFGTVSFLAKKSGNGTITLNKNSFALDANNQHVLSGTPAVSFNITAPASVPTQPSTQPTVTPSPESEEPAVTDTVTLQPTEQPVSQPAQNLFLATILSAVGNTLTLGTGSAWFGILVGLVILAAIVYAVNSFIRRKRKNLR
ncbi:FeoB-associated Cys-rich membrane protein, partial [Patescibacteria group bacterium]|nr:FeoB-associated Cys-rich membrane protein [Patescibacteria group bacterium]